MVFETRQITNKIKQQKEKLDYYKSADLSVILSEYHFMPEHMKINFINCKLNFVKIALQHFKNTT